MQNLKTPANPSDTYLKQEYVKFSAETSDIEINRPSKKIGNGNGMSLLRELESLRKRFEEIPEGRWRFLKEAPEENLQFLMEAPEKNLRFLNEIPEENRRFLKEAPEENLRFLMEAPEKNLRFLKETTLQQLLENNDLWYAVRKATLDEWSNVVDKDMRDTRNNQVHGGSVIADIEVIKNHTYSLKQSERWKRAFRYAYGISFDDIKDEDVPMKFYLTLNRRASITHMYAWKKKNRQKARNEIFKLCGKIIQAWRDEVGFLEEGSESLAQYERMNQRWLSYDAAV